MVKRLFGKLYGDKGRLSQALFNELWEQDIQLVSSSKAT
jgi:hypothetical protein